MWTNSNNCIQEQLSTEQGHLSNVFRIFVAYEPIWRPVFQENHHLTDQATKWTPLQHLALVQEENTEVFIYWKELSYLHYVEKRRQDSSTSIIYKATELQNYDVKALYISICQQER